MTGANTAPSGPRAEIVSPGDAELDRAAAIIRSGGLVAMPTETVYGLAADATDGMAVARIYEAKGRPSFNPLICHVANLAMAESCATFTQLAHDLVARFWPGPLTLVLPRTASCPVSELATAGLATIALRSPKHPAALGLIARSGRPLAAPSANRSEGLSPTTARHVSDRLGDVIDLIIDGGACRAGLESTIVALTPQGAVMLRPGALARAEIEAITGPLAAPHGASGVIAPGMLKRHYAPRAALRLDALDVGPDEAFLGFGEPPEGVVATHNLSREGNLAEAAANLFAMLHALDATHRKIAVAPIPSSGLGEGIRDRLNRAAARADKDSV